MEIPDIGTSEIRIKELKIPEINVFSSYNSNPSSLPLAPPVTVDIGVPVVDIPGCVEAHETNNAKNNQVSDDDERGLVTYCDSGIPGFNPIQYEPEQLIYTKEAPVPPVKSPEAPETPEVEAPEVKPQVNTATIECPTEAQELKEPVGTLVDDGTKKIVEYRLVGVECIPVKEDIQIPDQIIQAIPSAGAVTTTASIAVVATTSALLAKPLADLLLKVVKPTVKKVIKKIAAIRGKTAQVESVQERRDQQRIRSHAIRKLKGKE